MDSPTFDSQEADRLSSIRSPHRMACSCNWESPGSMVASWQKCRSPFASSPKRLLRWCTKIMEGPQNTTNKQNITHNKFMEDVPKKNAGFPIRVVQFVRAHVLQKWRASTAQKCYLIMEDFYDIYGKFHCPSLEKLVWTSTKNTWNILETPRRPTICKWLPFSIGCWFPKSSYRKWLEISIHPSTCRPYKIAAGDTCDKWLENQRTRKHN